MSVDNILEDFSNIRKNYEDDKHIEDIKIAENILKLTLDSSLNDKNIQDIIVKNKDYYVFLSKYPLVVNMILSSKEFDAEIFKRHIDNREDNPIDRLIYYAVEFAKKNKEKYGITNIKKFRREMYNDIKKTQEEFSKYKN